MTNTKSRAYAWAENVQKGRSDRAKATDAKRNATVTFDSDITVDEYRRWKKNPGRFDIRGIDTIPPEKKKKTKIPEKKVDVKDIRTKKKNKTRGKMEYSQSWYDNLPWKDDPELAARLAAEALAVENIEDISEAHAYLQDSAYDEIDSNYDRDERSIAIAHRRKMWDEVKAVDYSPRCVHASRRAKTPEQKKEARERMSLGLSSIGTGVSVAALVMALSPKRKRKGRINK